MRFDCDWPSSFRGIDFFTLMDNGDSNDDNDVD